MYEHEYGIAVSDAEWLEIADRASDALRWFLGSLTLFHAGGDAWKAWEAAMKPAIIDSQRTDEGACGYDGSWDPFGPRRGELGRVETTAWLVLAQEIWYRYDKVDSFLPR